MKINLFDMDYSYLYEDKKKINNNNNNNNKNIEPMEQLRKTK